MKTLFAALTLVLASLGTLAATPAMAYVQASPSYYDFGPVPAGMQASTTIFFYNMDNQPVRTFSVYCNGSAALFQCVSNCWSMAPYGSCSVTVYFYPHRGQNYREWLSVSGQGDGQYVTADVYGIDAKP